jgi:hypothetical protein
MSLQDRSILINISLHSFGQSRKDSSVTSKVLLDNSADGDSGSWSTNLLPKEAYKSISQLDSQIRKCHKDNTLPWSDKGSRILPSENFDNYMAQIRSFRRQREELVETFRRLYPTYLNAARAKRGVLFNPAHYPTDEQAAAQYDFVLNATPVPHENDFRCTIGAIQQSPGRRTKCRHRTLPTHRRSTGRHGRTPLRSRCQVQRYPRRKP